MTDINPAPARPGRIALIDMARGVAIIAMIVYHFAWDLSFLGLIATNVEEHWAWFAFARAIVSGFLFLAGVSLVLAHRDGMRWPAFWRRIAIVGGAALLVTGATYWQFPDSFVFFGVLHAIALFSVLALPFLRAPIWAVGGVAGFVLALPLFFSHPAFNSPFLAWLGFWEVPPLTNDLVPVFPFLAATLAGVLAARIALSRGWAHRLAGISDQGQVGRVLVVLGRWSLVIYLLHQPILLAALTPFASDVQPRTESREITFLQSCQTSCLESGSEFGYCQAYCNCGVNVVEMEDLWAALESTERTAEQAAAVDAVVDQCAAEAQDLMGTGAE